MLTNKIKIKFNRGKGEKVDRLTRLIRGRGWSLFFPINLSAGHPFNRRSVPIHPRPLLGYNARAMGEDKIIFKDPWFWPGMLVGGFFLSLTLWFNLGMDQSIMSYTAWVWKADHLPPYIGAFDHAFPGIFLIHRLVLELFGDTILDFRIFDFLVQLSGLVMIYYLARRMSGLSLAGFLAAGFYGIYYYNLKSADTGQREGFIFWFLLLGILAAVVSEKRFCLRAVLVGLICGLVFLLKPTYGLVWPVFGVYLLLQGIRDRPIPVWIELALFSFCCLAPSLAVIFYYWRLGYLPELYQALIWFNAEIYSRMSDPQIAAMVWRRGALPRLLFRDWPLILFPGIVFIGIQLRSGLLAKDKNIFWLILSLAMVGLINYRLQAKFFPYHLIVFWGMLMIFGGGAFAWAISWISRLLGRTRGKIFSGAALAGLILLMVLHLDPWMKKFALNYCFRDLNRAYLAGFNTDNDRQFASDYYRAAQYLQPMVRPGDRIVVFGGYPLIPFLLHKKMPTLFPCTHQLLLLRADGEVPPRQREWRERYAREIISARPEFFIITDRWPGQDHQLFHFASRELWGSFRAQFPSLYSFFINNYRLRTKIGRVSIYQALSADRGGTLP